MTVLLALLPYQVGSLLNPEPLKYAPRLMDDGLSSLTHVTGFGRSQAASGNLMADGADLTAAVRSARQPTTDPMETAL